MPLDYEVDSFYSLLIQVTDGGGLKTTCKCEIYVKDENDNAPEFLQPYFHFKLISENRLVGFVTATDKDSGNNARIHYRFKQQRTPFEVWKLFVRLDIY